MQDDGRYRIDDEAARMPVQGMELLIFLSLPITLYLSLAYSVFFLLIPGVLGFIVGGRHRWRDPLLCVLAIIIFGAGFVVGGMMVDGGLAGLALEYVRDLHIAFTGLPLFYIGIQQQRTLQLRQAAAL